ncbi:MAG: hypothetical protein LBL66_10000 [Clostridiales bacterium]|nr:hypothetical protein [Clostridiales bacterium]
MRGGRVKRPMWQSLYKKAHFVFCRDCRVALRAPRNDKRGVRAPCNDQATRFVHSLISRLRSK